LTKNGIRGFAAGILIATAVFAFFYYLIFNQGSQPVAKNVVRQAPLTEATVTNYLTAHHRKSIDIDAYNKWLADTQKTTASSTKSAANNSGSSTKSSASGNSKVITYKVHIKSGMALGDIAQDLVSGKILKSSQVNSFNQYFQKHNLEKYVQLGTFTVKSNMSIPDLAKAVTSQTN
jgi:YceG-like family.